MIRCPNCHMSYEDDKKVCPFCGAPNEEYKSNTDIFGERIKENDKEAEAKCPPRKKSVYITLSFTLAFLNINSMYKNGFKQGMILFWFRLVASIAFCIALYRTFHLITGLEKLYCVLICVGVAIIVNNIISGILAIKICSKGKAYDKFGRKLI